MGPTSNIKCPYKIQKRLRTQIKKNEQYDLGDPGDGDWSDISKEVKYCQSHQKLEEAGKDISESCQRRLVPSALSFQASCLWKSERINLCCCNNLSWKP
jgi:hypothetical protein